MSLTPREWLDWVFDQYGLTPNQMVAGARNGAKVASPALTLVCNVLSSRFESALIAEIVNARLTVEGLYVTADQVRHRLRDATREAHEVSREAIDHHVRLLSALPHEQGPDARSEEGLPAGWTENPLRDNSLGHVMASAATSDGSRGVTLWAWDDESARTGLHGAVRAIEGSDLPPTKDTP